MKLGQAMYEAEQAKNASADAGEGDASADASEEKADDEEVVDAEFSEVDEENKG